MSIRVLYSYLFAILILFQSHGTFPQNNYNQLSSPNFETISNEDGLPENSGTCILQDYLGYMWFGTQNGLVKYDGYSMKVFKPDTANNKSISGREIVALFEDSKRTLWIGTLNGLNRFNREDESFKSYGFNPNDSNSITSDSVHTIYEDRFGRFWIGTPNGLNLFDRESETFARFYFVDSNSKAVSHLNANQHSLGITAMIDDPVSNDILLGMGLEGLWRFDINKKQISGYEFKESFDTSTKIGRIHKFYKSRDGRIWMTSLNSLTGVDPVNREFKFYFDFPIKEEENFLADRYALSSIIEDRFGKIWAGFYAANIGLYYLDPNTGESNNFELIPDRSQNTLLNKIHSLYEDRSGIIWIGTWLTGVKKWNRFKNKFSVVQSNAIDLNNLSSPIIHSLICDPKGYTWFCTPKGLDKFDQRTYRYTHYLQNEKCVTEFMVYAAMIDHSGNLWLGTSNCGLVKFNSQNSTYRFYLNNPDELNLINKTVLCLLQDHLGYIWVGTQGFGIYKYDPGSGILVRYKHDPNDSLSLSEDVVLSILEDHKGNLWVGTNLGGLNKYNRETGEFSYAGFQNCLLLFEDSQNRFWVTENPSGLNLFDTEKLKVTANYSQDDGLASNAIIGVLEDYKKNLWLVTDVGITRFNTQHKTIKNFTVDNNLSNVFNLYFPACSGKGADGLLYFNTREGLVIFNPADIKDDPTPPQVIISNLSLFNRPDEKLKNDGFISELKAITLTYDQNDLRFDYVGLQFNEPLKNIYKYILENFDEDWVEAGTQRNATYTNLNPGEYIFRVKAANLDGIWSNEEALIKIIITPPWWKTNIAYILYAVILISIVYLTWKLQLRRIRIKQGYEMSRFEAEKLHEVDEIKSRFFTNISHEFRTPLTLILGPAKNILESTNEQKTKQNVSLIKKNAGRLLRLVNQLLDISKVESGKMKLETMPCNIIPLLKAWILPFTSYSERKRITLRFNSSEVEIIVYADKEKCEKIITNLLSNAFKFTPEGGAIEVSVDQRGDYVDIKVSDTGIGIPSDKIEKIFDRFYQLDGGNTREHEGTGIGLSLTKELVELHKGKIEVESEPGKGSKFTVSLLSGKDHLRPEEIIEKDETKVFEDEPRSPRFTIGEAGQRLEQEISNIEKEEKSKRAGISTEFIVKNSPLLLIVEDNSDVRTYIRENIITDYRILEAIDGEDGWHKSIEHLPDLIVSDVMMPKMDGFRLCEKLKTDERTSHIPLILLTAKAAKEDKLTGYETGADEYLMKPFDTDELKSRIKNLIDQRKRLQEHFRKQGLAGIDEQKITSIDKKFLQKSFDIINKNISNPSFSVEMFAEELAISRSGLQKKIQSLIGETPGQLIRRTRLNKAAKLIKHKFGNLTEIGLEVGYNNPAHFSEAFKRQHGMTPSQFQKDNNC